MSVREITGREEGFQFIAKETEAPGNSPVHVGPVICTIEVQIHCWQRSKQALPPPSRHTFKPITPLAIAKCLSGLTAGRSARAKGGSRVPWSQVSGKSWVPSNATPRQLPGRNAPESAPRRPPDESPAAAHLSWLTVVRQSRGHWPRQ